MTQKNICYIDSHCHLVGLDSEGGAAQDIANAKLAGVVQMITIGIDLASSQAAVALAKKYSQRQPHIWASVGIHPNNSADIREEDYSTLRNLYRHNRPLIKAFGEIGLDYYRDYAAEDIQKKHFSAQLALAEELRLPVIIHNREANDDCLSILRDFALEEGCVMHCFSGDYTLAKKVLDMGMYISLSGVVTFKNAPELHEVAQKIPLERMLIETDAPFLSPVPYRGKRNEPAYLPQTAMKIAELRDMPLEETAEALYNNTVRFFNLPDREGRQTAEQKERGND